MVNKADSQQVTTAAERAPSVSGASLRGGLVTQGLELVTSPGLGLINTGRSERCNWSEAVSGPLRIEANNCELRDFSPGTRIAKGALLTARGQPHFAPVAARVEPVAGALNLYPDAHEGETAIPPLAPFAPAMDLKSNLAQIIARAREAGIVGMGGAGFPAWRKLAALSSDRPVVVINAVECEPGLASDRALWHARQADLPHVLAWLHASLMPHHLELAVKMGTQVPDVVRGLCEVLFTPHIYPAGDERILHRALVAPPAERPTDDNVLVFNVATLFALFDAVVTGWPPLSRWVTVLSPDRAPRVGEVLFGTTFESLLSVAGFDDSVRDTCTLATGGPFMHKLVSGSGCVGPTTTGLIVLPESSPAVVATPCIGCGRCDPVCPMHLPVQQLHHAADAGRDDQLRALRVSNCSGCGCCDAVCPSDLSLATQLRQASLEIERRAVAERIAAVTQAKAERHTAREQRRSESRARRRNTPAGDMGAVKRARLDDLIARARDKSSREPS